MCEKGCWHGADASSVALQGSTLPLRASSPEKTWDEVGELKNSIGIEVDEALRMGGSGFLGESDAGEADPPGFLHQLQCPWPKDPNICSLRPRNQPILI